MPLRAVSRLLRQPGRVFGEHTAAMQAFDNACMLKCGVHLPECP